MKVLFIGGTGNISGAVSRLALSKGIDLYLLNRGHTPTDLRGATVIRADITDESQVEAALGHEMFDVVVNWIAFVPADIERDIRLFKERTGQYIFISSASAYQKPLSHPVVTESTPLANPYWQYSRDKIACEEKLNHVYRDDGFPITIVRPSLTYETVIPVAIGSWDDYTIVDRMKKGKEIIVHGDGSSLWTITHSEDFAKGFVPLMGHQQAIGESFHITSDEILNWNQIYEAVASAAGVEANIIHIPSDFIARFDDSHVGSLHGDKAVSVVFDNSKIKRFVPGFVATIPFKAGIKRTVEWFEADPARMKIVHESNQFMNQVLTAYKRAYEAPQ
jgi:nucleoside-diphosphate-sugar epimerase